jgi:hypothetical protein
MRQGSRRFSSLIVTASLAAVLLPVGGAHASLLFDNGTGDFTRSRGPGNNPGAGQGIAVSTTTSLTNIAVDLAMPNAGNVKFMIWDSTNSSLLLITPPEAVAASATPTYVESPNFSFTLNPGNTYFFGVIGDSAIDINSYQPPVAFNQNGLDALFGNGLDEMTLRLFGTQAAVPAPLIGHGLPVLLAVGGMLFGAKLFERSKKRRSLGTAVAHGA